MVRSDDFDFDAMAALAKNSPLEFAEWRAQLIDLAISSCANPEKGKTIQSKIDSYRADILEGHEPYVAIMAKRLNALVGQISNFLVDLKSGS